jgi:hypothetical protein
MILRCRATAARDQAITKRVIHEATRRHTKKMRPPSFHLRVAWLIISRLVRQLISRRFEPMGVGSLFALRDVANSRSRVGIEPKRDAEGQGRKERRNSFS